MIKVGLSTASVFPESADYAFEVAKRLGYDGVELMVWTDPVSQQPDAIKRISRRHDLPVLAVHAPCLLAAQRVWTTDPWEKIRRAEAAAQLLGARTVVLHPPFRWQRGYADRLGEWLDEHDDEGTGVTFAMENMFPLRVRRRRIDGYRPGWDVVEHGFPSYTLDLSHTAVSGSDAMAMAARMAGRLRHVHLGDGTGSGHDDHLVPGRGTQPCGQVLQWLATEAETRPPDAQPTVIVEITTRQAANRAEREADLAEALTFARLHLG